MSVKTEWKISVDRNSVLVEIGYRVIVYHSRQKNTAEEYTRGTLTRITVDADGDEDWTIMTDDGETVVYPPEYCGKEN